MSPLLRNHLKKITWILILPYFVVPKLFNLYLGSSKKHYSIKFHFFYSKLKLKYLVFLLYFLFLLKKEICDFFLFIYSWNTKNMQKDIIINGIPIFIIKLYYISWTIQNLICKRWSNNNFILILIKHGQNSIIFLKFSW